METRARLRRMGFPFLRWAVALAAAGFFAMLVYHPGAMPAWRTAVPSFPAAATRIVSLTVATDEILLALVAPERIAALTHLADAPEFSNVAVEARAVRGRVPPGSTEAILAAGPDLVLLAAYVEAARKEILRAAGVPFIDVRPSGSVAEIKEYIAAIGRAVGAGARAAEIVRAMDVRLTDVTARIAHSERPRVLYYTGDGVTAGAGTSIDEIISLGGGENVAAVAGVQGFRKVSRETLVMLDPEVILMSGGRGHEALRQRLLRDAGL